MSYGDEATDIHARKIPEEGSTYFGWLVISIDSIRKKDKNYYLQVFSKECYQIEKERIVIRYITDDLNFSSDDSEEI